MYNFFHVYKYHLGVLVALLIGVGIIRFPLNLLADTTSFFTNTTSSTSTSTYSNTTTATPVTFSVNPTSDVDCTIPTAPKTKTAFVVNPATGGGFTLSRGTTSETTSTMPGPRFLPNGVYAWSGVVNPHYVGSGILSGKFVLDVRCGLSGTVNTTATTSTVTTESVVVTTGTAVATHDEDDDTDDHIYEGTSSSSSVQAVALAPSPLSTLPPPPYVSSPLPLPVTTTTSLPKISLPPPTPTAVNNSLPVSSVRTAPLPPLPVNVVPPPVHRETDDDDEEDSVHSSTRTVAREPMLLPAVEHLERFDEKKRKEIASNVSKKEQEEIIHRVKSPAVCTDVKECAVYCEQKEARESSACVSFAQTRMPQSSPIKPSLVGSVSFERIEYILSDTTVRPPELPSVVKNPQEFQQYCTDLKNSDVCARVLVDNKLASSETIVERAQTLKQNYEEEKKIFTERTGARVFVDSDNDELADYDEVNIYHTDPKNGDTDRDGVLDGKEIALRTSPRNKMSVLLTASSSVGAHPASAVISALISENHPLVSGSTDSKLLMIKEVIASRSASSTPTLDTLGAPRASQLTFTGTAIPNSFVTLYIFSEPVVVMVKTNSLGEWSYTLDKELPDGTHHVISAITDGDGRVLAKSEPLPFVKVAEAVTLGNVDVALPLAQKEPGFFSGLSLYSFITLIVGVLGMSFLVIGVIVRRRDGEHETMKM